MVGRDMDGFIDDITKVLSKEMIKGEKGGVQKSIILIIIRLIFCLFIFMLLIKCI